MELRSWPYARICDTLCSQGVTLALTRPSSLSLRWQMNSAYIYFPQIRICKSHLLGDLFCLLKCAIKCINEWGMSMTPCLLWKPEQVSSYLVSSLLSSPLLISPPFSSLSFYFPKWMHKQESYQVHSIIFERFFLKKLFSYKTCICIPQFQIREYHTF